MSCSGETSRGSINSSAEWAPRVQSVGGKRYYFLVFSSARKSEVQFALPRTRLSPPVSDASSRIYVTALVLDEASNTFETRPAIYVWNQDWVYEETGTVTFGPTSNFDPSWMP